VLRPPACLSSLPPTSTQERPPKGTVLLPSHAGLQRGGLLHRVYVFSHHLQVLPAASTGYTDLIRSLPALFPQHTTAGNNGSCCCTQSKHTHAALTPAAAVAAWPSLASAIYCCCCC